MVNFKSRPCGKAIWPPASGGCSIAGAARGIGAAYANALAAKETENSGEGEMTNRRVAAIGKAFPRLVPALFAMALAAGMGLHPAAAAETFDLDVIIPLSGGGAFLGTEEQQTIQVTERAINEQGGIHGKPVRFIFHDDQSSPQIAVQLANDVIQTHPPIVFGSTISAICNAMSPLMRDGPVQYCFSPSIHPAPGGYVFTSQIASNDQQSALLRYFRFKGWSRIALITTTDASGQDAERSITRLLQTPENRDLKLVENGHFNPTDVSVAAQIERIRAANAEVVVSWATAAAGATVFRGLVQAGLDLPVAASGSNMTYSQMIQYAAFLPKQLYFGVSAWAAAGAANIDLPPAVAAEQKLFFALIAKAGIHADIGADLGWDPERLIAAALNKLPPGAGAAELRNYLLHLKGYAGIDGMYDFEAVPQRGLDISDALVVRWDSQKKDWDPVSKLTGIPLTP